MRASGMSTPGYTPLSMSANMTPQQMAIMRQQQTLFYQQQQQAHLRQLQPGAANRRVAAVYEQQQPRYAPMHPATSAQQQHQFNAAAQLQAQQQQQQAAAAAAASHHMVNGGAGWPYGMPRTPQPYASSSMINGAPVPPHHPYVMADGSGGAAYLAHQHPSTSLTGYTPTNSAMHPNGCNAMPTSSSTSPFANPAGHPSRGHTPIAAQPPSSTLSHHASPQAAAAAAAGIHPNFDAAPLRQFASSTTPQPMASGPSNGAMLNGYTTSQFGAPMFAANAMPPPPPAAVDKPPTDLNFNSAANFDTSNGTISSPPSNAATTSRVPSLDPAAATASGTRVDDRSFFAHYPDAASCPPSLDVDELDIGALDVHPFVSLNLKNIDAYENVCRAASPSSSPALKNGINTAKVSTAPLPILRNFSAIFRLLVECCYASASSRVVNIMILVLVASDIKKHKARSGRSPLLFCLHSNLHSLVLRASFCLFVYLAPETSINTRSLHVSDDG